MVAAMCETENIDGNAKSFVGFVSLISDKIAMPFKGAALVAHSV